MARSGQDYLEKLQGLLPLGDAWPRDPEAVLTKLLRAWAEAFRSADERGDDLLQEADPRSALELLTDWERAAGLPNPCLTIADTLQERRIVLVSRLTEIGGQSREFFAGLAASIGYDGISIEEFRPFICALGRCGDSLGGTPGVRFYWRVAVPGPRTTLFLSGASRCGDRLAEFDRASDLECLLERLKPAQTRLIFAYEGI